MNLTNTYKGYTISFNGTRYEILLEDELQTDRIKSLEACIAWVDKQLKEEFVRTKVLVTGWRGNFKEAEVTSIVGDRAWVVYTDGKREMVSCKDLRVLSESNLAKIEELTKLEKQVEELTRQARQIRDNLEVFDINSMIIMK